MLTFPSQSGLFCLECDASNFTMGAILLQQQEDGLFHLIGFMSKSFSNMEWNYQIHDKEMLAIMCCRQDNSLLWGLPMESSFRGQSVSPRLYHILHIILHIKLRRNTGGTGILDFQKRSKPRRCHLMKTS